MPVRGQDYSIDAASRWNVNMNEIHNLIHEGKLYYISRRVAASASAMEVHVKTGARSVHLETSAKAGLATALSVLEGVTISNDGTALPGRNYNRNFSDDGGIVRCFHTPAFTGGTTIRENQAGFGTSPGTGSSGETDGRREYVLKPNTSYVFRLAPAASTDVVFIADFYEGGA